ncbi:hypothetical protein LTR70_009507 [Exophiala xenobiotica]|uniref:Uncharacterized protein n=1 Tax=Lithohypha guttulata TaxID=1690604 RepID=A0ABR0JYM2_9EURO|nr:hypothetical protein LTR24_009417 [Lithohypha guttulata]KAK5310401.1 hypothetical protein LTR70_009507 [Exophiala xenobiotica]
MDRSVRLNPVAKRGGTLTPTERLSVTDRSDDGTTESDTDSDADLPSLPDLFSRRSEAPTNLYTTTVEGNVQQEQRYDKHDSVEIPESPSSNDCLNGSKDKDRAAAATEPDHDVTAETDKDLQQQELYGSNSPHPSISCPMQRASRNHGPRKPSEAADQISQGPVKELGKSSANVSEISFLGVYERRETPRGPEYRCLVERWLRPQDGIPREQIKEYDHEMAQKRRRQSLRKRQHDSDCDDMDARIRKKIRRWKEHSQ